MKKTFFANHALVLVLALNSLLSAGAQAASCEDAFGKQPLPVRTIEKQEIVLQPGDTVYHLAECKFCVDPETNRPGTFLLKPEKDGRLGCPGCGSAFVKGGRNGNDGWQPEFYKNADGHIVLVVRDALVPNDPAIQKLLGKRNLWTCSFCTGQNRITVEQEDAHPSKISCTNCGGSKESSDQKSLVNNGLFTRLVEGTSDTATDASIVASASAALDVGLPSAAGFRGDGAPIEPEKLTRRTNLQIPGTSFLRTRAGIASISLAAAGAIGMVWWGMDAYTITGKVKSVQGETAWVDYTDRNGKLHTIDLTPAGPSKSIKQWRIGDSVPLYFRNLSSTPKGAEGVDGTVAKPGELHKQKK